MARIPLSRFLGQFGAGTLQRWTSVKSSIHEAAYSGDAELVPNNRSYDGAEDFNGVQHFWVRKRRDTHWECDARDATQNIIHVKDLFRNSFGVADLGDQPGRDLDDWLQAKRELERGALSRAQAG